MSILLNDEEDSDYDTLGLHWNDEPRSFIVWV